MARNKRNLLILGANPETAMLVRVARSMGYITHVVDLVPKSPGKLVSDYGYDGDASDVDFLSELIIKNKIEGVVVGVADILVPAYEAVCRKFGFPCFATKSAVELFSSKDNFRKVCEKFGFKSIPSFTDLIERDTCRDIDYPVIVKPVDSGAGVGVSVVTGATDLKVAIEKAKSLSKVNRFVCEKYITDGLDIQAYYTIVNGQVYLSSLVDRTLNRSQGKLSPVCIGAIYNSSVKELFLSNANDRFVELLNYADIRNGIFSVQCFVWDSDIYPYDPGFRLQGEGQHLILKAINGFDHREMLINLAMTGSMFEGDFSRVNDLDLNGKFACSVWILLGPGKISYVSGMESIRGMSNFIDVVQRFEVGDVIRESFIGSERQVFARFYIASDELDGLKSSVEFIHQNLVIKDSMGYSMIVDRYTI